MSYVIPSVLVYQQLATNGGVANITPDLDTVIIGPCNNVVNYVAGSVASLTATAALNPSTNGAFTLTDNTVVNTVKLGSTKVGQLVDVASVVLYMNSTLVETKVLYMTGSAGNNSLSFATYTGTCNAIAGNNVLSNISNPTQLNIGDNLVISGAGVGGSNLEVSILAVSGSDVTISANAGTTVNTAGVTRTSFNNLNSTSSTLRVESGDKVYITYGASSFSTTVLDVVGTTGVITGVITSDILPVGISTPFTVSIQKTYNNLLIPLSYNSHTNYSTINTAAQGTVSINPRPQVSYGTVISGTVHIQYSALRLDLSATLLDINNVTDAEGTLGEATDQNPLSLGVVLALANTVGRIRAVAISSNDLVGYLAALDLIENEKVYCVVPLTQSIDILEAVQQHVEQMSTPENAAWRIALLNTEIPSVSYVGQYNPNFVNANSGNNTVTLSGPNYVLTSSNSQFVTDGVVPGDSVKVSSHAPAAQVVTSMTVLTVVSNQQLIVSSPITLSAVNFYVQRTLTKAQQAEIVAANSETFTSHRIVHVQPDLAGVIVNGVTKYLPGYYLCAAMSGLVSGLPAQQSLTNIGLAGVVDLLHSNRYFTRAQLSTISGSGTCLLVQEAVGTIPYIRHSLTTDMTVLQYRELQQVKNIDFLSYFFHDILKSFPGRYNITPDTLQILRTTLIAGAKLLQGKKLPKIGPPLLDYQIKSLTQDSTNKDTVIIEMPVTTPTVMNYINLYLIY